MFEVGIYEAKTNLPKIIKRVRRGEECIITYRGKPVAKINHIMLDAQKEIARSWHALRVLRRKNAGLPSWKEVYDLRHEGHQW